MTRTSSPQELGSALVGLLHTDLRRGHWRVAIRHYLMLIACAYQVPEDLQEQCLRCISLCTPVEFEKISSMVANWQACCRR